MSVEAFTSLIHEVRECLDRTPVRSGVFEAIMGEVRVAQFIAEHAEDFDEVRTGITRSMLELALRNVLMRPELAHAHDAAQRALRVVLSREDGRKVELPPAARELSAIGVADLGLALVHARDAIGLVSHVQLVNDDRRSDDTMRELMKKLQGVVSILERVHAEYAA